MKRIQYVIPLILIFVVMQFNACGTITQTQCETTATAVYNAATFLCSIIPLASGDTITQQKMANANIQMLNGYINAVRACPASNEREKVLGELLLALRSSQNVDVGKNH